MSKTNVSLILALTIFSLLAVSHVQAQLSSASVTGILKDSTGAAVEGAEVTLRNEETAVERRSSSNAAGNYVFQNVAPGRYIMVTSKSGFRTTQIGPFTLAVNQTSTIDAVLELGTLQQTVSVEAIAQSIEGSTAELGAVVAQKQVVDLPLNGRNFTQLLSLTPGVAPISVAQNSAGYGSAVTNGSQFTFPSINGQSNRSNYYMTDGINNNGSFVGTYGVPPIIDAIQEFKVNSHNDQAQFGGSLGGLINVVTRSGSNIYHGTAWEYVRNDAFDARSTFLRSVTPFRQNQFGFSLGGPVIIPKLYNGRNHTFVFGAFQQFYYRRPADSLFRVPTEANLNGNLSDQPGAIYNPFSTRPDPNRPGSFIRDPFANNQIPGNLVNPGMVAYSRATVPAPEFTGVANRNGIDHTPVRQDQREYTFRVDQNMGDRDSIWFRFSALNQDNTASGGRPSLVTTVERPAKNYGVSYVHTFSPSLVLQAQYGRLITSDNASTRFRNLPSGFLQSVGFSDSFVSGFVSAGSLIPALNVAGFFSGGESNGINTSLNDIHQFSGTVTKIAGTHTLTFGGGFDTTNFEAFLESANVGFATQQTSNPANPSEVGNALASFLLNVPDSAGRRNVHETVRWGGVGNGFFQDSWKATSKLTVNVGLRYDVTLVNPYGREDTLGKNGGIETGNMDVGTGIYSIQKLPPSCAQRGFAPCIPTPDGSLPQHVVVDPRGKILRNTMNNLGPRLGFAYRLSPNTAIRSSFGVFYDNWAGITQRSQGYEGNWPDVSQQLGNNFNVPIPAKPTPGITAQDPFQSGAGRQFPAPTPFNQVAWYLDPYMKNPYSMQWNFGVEHQFNNSTSVSVNYVGSGSRRTSMGGYNNVALTPGPGNPRDRAPFPYFVPTYYEKSVGRANYDAFQFQYERRYSGGFAYQVAYTWSKSLDIGASGFYGVEGNSIQDPYHTNRDHSVSAYDLTHVLAVNLLYELPVGKGKAFSARNRAADFILGNWQINTITVARSGAPYNVIVNADVPNTGILSVRGNLTGNPDLSNPSRDGWFNKAAFAVPAQYSFGNLGRNRLRSDPFWNIDLSVFRQFLVREAWRFELRAEAFNAVNTVVYGIPDTNLASPTFSRVFGTANSPRVLQLGMKMIF